MELINIIRRTLMKFSKNEAILRKAKVCERCYNFRMGLYLDKIVSTAKLSHNNKKLRKKGIKVDMEYNKKGEGQAKVIDNNPINYVDLVLHERTIPNKNYIITEMKLESPNNGYIEGCNSDRERLRDMTASHKEYKYKIGVFLYFLVKDTYSDGIPIIAEYYQDGEYKMTEKIYNNQITAVDKDLISIKKSLVPYLVNSE